MIKSIVSEMEEIANKKMDEMKEMVKNNKVRIDKEILMHSKEIDRLKDEMRNCKRLENEYENNFFTKELAESLLANRLGLDTIGYSVLLDNIVKNRREMILFLLLLDSRMNSSTQDIGKRNFKEEINCILKGFY